MNELTQEVIDKHKYILSEYTESVVPHPLVWRYVLEFWPNPLREKWGYLSNKHEESGLSWKEAEWKAFRFFVADTLRFMEANPTKQIPWRIPQEYSYTQLDQYNTILADDLFFVNLKIGAQVNAAARAGESWRQSSVVVTKIMAKPSSSAKKPSSPRKKKEPVVPKQSKPVPTNPTGYFF